MPSVGIGFFSPNRKLDPTEQDRRALRLCCSQGHSSAEGRGPEGLKKPMLEFGTRVVVWDTTGDGQLRRCLTPHQSIPCRAPREQSPSAVPSSLSFSLPAILPPRRRPF